MITTVHKLNTPRIDVAAMIDRTTYAVRTVSRTSPAAMRRLLILFIALFAVLYVSVAHFTIFEAGKFSDLRVAIHTEEQNAADREALLTELLSAHAIRAQKDTGGLVDVASISYVEGGHVVAEASPVTPTN